MTDARLWLAGLVVLPGLVIRRFGLAPRPLDSRFDASDDILRARQERVPARR
jgi:hypothetical protein